VVKTGRLEGPASALPTNLPKANWLGLRLRPPPVADEGSRLAAAAVEILDRRAVGGPKNFGSPQRGDLTQRHKSRDWQARNKYHRVASLRP